MYGICQKSEHDKVCPSVERQFTEASSQRALRFKYPPLVVKRQAHALTHAAVRQGGMSPLSGRKLTGGNHSSSASLKRIMKRFKLYNEQGIK
ncbi:hypothetical protein PoB_003889900 [Plakobranchus ocellatus]|uniref:Uncharacterized protein n=1 Tax=Plakobranchus ocellatus TaxID=259542 RepID=A0AAV4AX70_9GAST|nr:hypothetical protein PoB_003889900 [Plakobranchus ocellatus]